MSAVKSRVEENRRKFRNSEVAFGIMCFRCKCKTIKNSFKTHVVNFNNSVIIIKNVPCEECEQCGEIFYTDEVAEQLEKLVDAAKGLLQDISVIDYSKVA